MSVATSIAAYEDCFELLDRALELERGIRVSQPNEGKGHLLVTRLNYARVLHRQQSREVYPSDSPSYGVSPYDSLVVRKPKFLDEGWWIYIERRTVVGKIEELAAE